MGAEEDSEEKTGIPDILEMIEKLKGQLDEFERLKERIEASIESAGKLVPNLEEEKKRLEEDIRGKRGKTEEIAKMILKLESKKTELEEDIKGSEETLSQIRNQIDFISQAKKGKR